MPTRILMPLFWSTRFAPPRRTMFWRNFFLAFPSLVLTRFCSFPPPDFHTKSRVNASEGVLMGFIGSKGPLIIKKPHRDLLSALKKNGLAPALVEWHTHKKNILASHAFRKVSGDLKNGGFLFKFFSSPILDNIPPGLQVRNLRSILDILSSPPQSIHYKFYHQSVFSSPEGVAHRSRFLYFHGSPFDLGFNQLMPSLVTARASGSASPSPVLFPDLSESSIN